MRLLTRADGKERTAWKENAALWMLELQSCSGGLTAGLTGIAAVLFSRGASVSPWRFYESLVSCMLLMCIEGLLLPGCRERGCMLNTDVVDRPDPASDLRRGESQCHACKWLLTLGATIDSTLSQGKDIA